MSMMKAIWSKTPQIYKYGLGSCAAFLLAVVLAQKKIIL